MMLILSFMLSLAWASRWLSAQILDLAHVCRKPVHVPDSARESDRRVPPQISAPGELVETGRDLDRAVARDRGQREERALVARRPAAAPSSSKAKRRSPAGAPSTGVGTGSAQSGVGPSANRNRRRRALRHRPRRAAWSRVRPRAGPSGSQASSPRPALAFLGTRAFGRGERGVLRRRAAGEHQLALAFGRHAQLLADRIVELETQRHRLAASCGTTRKRQDHVAAISDRRSRRCRPCAAAPATAPRSP